MQVVRPVQRVLVDVAVDVAGQRRIGERRVGGPGGVGALPPRPHAQVGVVAVALIGHGRHQHGDAGGSAAPRRAHHERQMLLMPPVRRGQPRRVAARQIVRHRQSEVLRPAGILQIVPMEVDGAVLVRGQPIAGLLAAEVVAGHRACRQIHDAPVPAVAGHVARKGGADVAREVPRAGQGAGFGQRGEVVGAVGPRPQPFPGDRTRQQPRAPFWRR